MERYAYNKEEIVQFDSAVGTFQAVSELGQETVKNWNIQQEFLAMRRGAVDTVCRHNYELDRAFTLTRRGERAWEEKPPKRCPKEGETLTSPLWNPTPSDGKGLRVVGLCLSLCVFALCWWPRTGHSYC